MQGSAELKAENQHELQVMQCVRDQLDEYSHVAGIKAISDALEEKAINQEKLYLLRAQILQIYRLEQAETSELFYKALFSLLLLLAKYAPYDVEPVDQNGLSPPLICAVSQQPIEEKFRVLTISGYQFDGSNPPLFDWLVEQGIPQNRDTLGQREIDYLVARKNAINTPDSQAPEIPHPNPPKPMSRAEAAHAGLTIGYCVGMLTFALLAALPPFLLAAGIISLFGLAACGAIVGAIAAEKMGKLRDYFHRPAAKTREIFSRIQTYNQIKQVPEAKPVAELKAAAPEEKIQQQAEVQAQSRLAEVKINSPEVAAQPPLLPRSPTPEQPRRLPIGLDRLLTQVENKNKLEVKQKKEEEKLEKKYSATDLEAENKNVLPRDDLRQDLLSESVSPEQQQFKLEQERKRIRNSFLDRVTANAKRSAEASQESVQPGRRLV